MPGRPGPASPASPSAWSARPRWSRCARWWAWPGPKGLNLVPVSSGAPHLKGGSVPAAPGVIVDFSRMDRIVRLDRRNRVALVEPGVTFPALREAAAKQGLRVLAPLAPRPGKSVLASCLEREPFLIPKYHWDSTDPLLCMEVVFGTGDLFRTGSAAGPGSLEDQWALGNAQKNPMGPASSDLGKLVQGSQGTLGLVTWASVKLELAPAIRKFYFIQAASLEELNGFVYEACKRRLGDEMLVLGPRCPGRAGGREPGGDRRLRRAPGPLHTYLRSVRNRRVPAGAQGGLPGEGPGRRRPPARAHPGERAAGDRPRPAWPVNWTAPARTPPRMSPGGSRASRAAAGRSSSSPPWTAPPVSSPPCGRRPRGTATRRRTWACTSSPSGRGSSCHLEFQIFYNPSEKAGTARAEELARDAAAAMAEAGAFFSRPHEPWIGPAYDRCPDTVYALRELKKVFDPDGVLNRGKLCFAERRRRQPGEVSEMALEDYREDMAACVRCSSCKWVPFNQMRSSRFSHNCPSINRFNFHSFSGSGRMNMGLSIMDGRSELTEKVCEVIYSCQLCGACDVTCKTYREIIDLTEVLLELRGKCVEDGQLLLEHMAAIDALKQENNMLGEPKAERGAWAEGLDLKDINREKVDVMLHAGCRFSYDKELWPALRGAVRLLLRPPGWTWASPGRRSRAAAGAPTSWATGARPATSPRTCRRG